VTSWVDPEDGLRELLALGKAPNADALHRVLVLSRPVRHSTDTMEPLWLLRRIAETEPEEALTTAFLLLTDRRWRKVLSQLVRRIADSGCLEVDDLDELAELFVAADRALFWAVPQGWFGGEEIVIAEVDEVSIDEGDADDGAVVADEPDDDGTARVAREVHPPLRRWAAARLVAREPAEVDALIEQTALLDARAAAAIMAGLLDSIEHVDAATRDRLIDGAVTWPDHGVRRAGIELLAARGRAEAAHRLAARDPNARIRDWAPSLLAERIDDADSDQGRPATASRTDQQALF
jgi:hypothetical protein